MVLPLKPIRYVFYRILKWKLTDARESMPAFAAAGATTLLLGLNALLALVVFCALSGRPFPEVHRGIAEYAAGAILVLAMYCVMDSAWVANGNFAKLQREFETRNQRQESVRTVLFWSYVALSATTPFLFAILWRARHS